MKNVSCLAAALALSFSLAACGKGEGTVSGGVGVSTEGSMSNGSSRGVDVTNSVKDSSSTDQSVTMTLPATVMVYPALHPTDQLYSDMISEIKSGEHPLRPYVERTWPAGATPRHVIALAATFATAPMEFWRVRPASLMRGRADGRGGAAEWAYIDTTETSACVTNSVGGQIAAALAKAVQPDLTAGRAQAARMVDSMTQPQVQAIVATCTQEVDERAHRRLGQGDPHWTAQDYKAEGKAAGVVVTQFGVPWFGEGRFNGTNYEIRVANAVSSSTDGTVTYKRSETTDDNESTKASAQIGK